MEVRGHLGTESLMHMYESTSHGKLWIASDYLNVPYGACGVDAGGAQAVEVCLIPVKGCQRRAELAVLVLQMPDET